VGSEPKAKCWPDEQEPHKRRSCWVRRQLSLKSYTYTEDAVVDAAGISVKAGVHYPGMSHVVHRATVVERRQDAA